MPAWRIALVGLFVVSSAAGIASCGFNEFARSQATNLLARGEIIPSSYVERAEGEENDLWDWCERDQITGNTLCLRTWKLSKVWRLYLLLENGSTHLRLERIP